MYGPLVVDLGAHLALVDGDPLELSHLQFVVLTALVRGSGRVVSNSELRRAAATVVPPTERTVTTAVSRLRSQLSRRRPSTSIEVVRARGYRLIA